LARINSLVSLVQSLTKGEKKYFTMQASLQKGTKDYIRLFHLIAKKTETRQLKKEFLQAKHTASYETSCKYLFNLLTKYLVQLRQEKDISNQLLNNLMKANLLFEKSLYEEGFVQLKNIKKKAAEKELRLIELLACRMELNYYSQINFYHITEKQLIPLQMHIEDLLRIQKKEQQHQNLYELIKYRFLYKGTTRSAEQTAGFNDLVVSEMNLMNSSAGAGFQIEKAHLLFQSYFFLTTNDTVSALKVSYRLNELFENHHSLWKDQPGDYIFMLEGILDSLRTLGQYNDLVFFLNKLRKFKSSSFTVQIIVEKIIYVYDLAVLLDTGEFSAAMKLVKNNNSSLFKNILLLDASQQAEVYLYTALAYFMNDELSHAQQNLRSVLLENKLFYNLPVYKTFRLIRLIVHYQLNDHEYIYYEARSIKRSMRMEKNGLYLLEKTLLKFLELNPLPVSVKERNLVWEKLQPAFTRIKKDKYELQLLKIFDFSLWLKSILTKQSFSELLKIKTKELNDKVK
jgi:hypothetical protein